jgi:hypothetical protein
MAKTPNLSATQLAALLAAAEAGALRRAPGGYTGLNKADLHKARTVFLLEREGLLARGEAGSEVSLAPTPAGWEIATRHAASTQIAHRAIEVAA